MEQRVFLRGQTWRLVTLCLCAGMLIVMLIPGVFPYLLRTTVNPEGTFYAENYFPSYTWTAFFSWGAFGAGVLCAVFCVIGVWKKRNMTVPVWICGGFILFMVYKIFVLANPLQFWVDGYYLPIVPPVLAVGVMVSAWMGWRCDRKK